ncbi:TetR family transcriptional regulator [Paenibacillus yonginensis]|uniref:TetR family transcriptional regulator n=2 Tax=Paenibacillus TaxID=44249 RepID=A0A1B1N2R0_9BACL|nr:MULTISPECIES: TetR/AcrR family transcriptional regulator [Paenibacillus]ANS75718.1 TetR family transcriptional regulator [Paenibacillus yonginensis]GGA48205.1 TetR family transcriptional regulator [Paenibacillus physcomitrellae]
MTGKRGRPRSIETEKSILQASFELLLEMGFASVTIEKIAERAGVSKATIYKWWPNKAAVVMDGFLSGVSKRLPVPDTGSVYEDLLKHAAYVVSFLTSIEGKVLSEIIGEGQSDPTLAEAYQTRYFAPRRAEAKQIIARGIERGELNKEIDMDLFIDLIYGPFFYRLIMTGGELNEAYVHQIVNAAFYGIRTKTP